MRELPFHQAEPGEERIKESAEQKKTGEGKRNGHVMSATVDKNAIWWKLLVVSLYMAAGPTLILLNKNIMSDHDFKYPITLSGLGMVAASLVSWSAIRFGGAPCKPEVYELISSKKWFTHCLPVGICKAATLTAGTATYMYLNVGFIQMLKAFSPVVVLVTSSFLKVEAPRGGVVLAVVLICSGTAFTCGYDPSAGVVGLSLHAAAAVTEAVNLVLTQYLLQNKSFSVLEAQFALAPPGVLFLALAAMALEWRSMAETGRYAAVAEHPFKFLAAATLGLVINFLTFLVIQVTSSLTLKILGMVRNVALVGVGVLAYQEVVPFKEAVGFSVSLVGLCGYYYFKANGEANERVHASLTACVPWSLKKRDAKAEGAEDLAALASHQTPRSPRHNVSRGGGHCHVVV